MTLETFFARHPKVALGFSGGVDSSYLLYAGRQYGADIRPYFVRTAFQPEFELRDAEEIARQLDVKLTVIHADILGHPIVAENPADRCYHCKQVIFTVLKEQAARDGYRILLDGSNASDNEGDRPGMRALRELSVRSPLRECGLTKQAIRELSREAGLFTWDKPAYACLATRIPTGQAITEEILGKVEEAENFLFSLGFTDFRVRVAGGAAKLQLPESQMEKAVQKRGEILAAIKPLFVSVLLDFEGR